MPKEKKSTEIQGSEKEFLDLFRQLCTSRSPWQVWTDLMGAFACALSNVADPDAKRRAIREKEYEACIKRLGGGNEIPAHLFAIITIALDRNPEQDFLGQMFMSLELGNHWKGQFFTSYSVAKIMARASFDGDVASKADSRDYISVNDPACGAGVTLIATANILRESKINYQQKALFVAQDIDRVAAQMCYIQLSLLGCAGYVVVADTLANPVKCGSVLEPYEGDNQEFWYTLFYWSDMWAIRRIKEKFRSLSPRPVEETQKPGRKWHRAIFDFRKEEVVWEI